MDDSDKIRNLRYISVDILNLIKKENKAIMESPIGPNVDNSTLECNIKIRKAVVQTLKGVENGNAYLLDNYTMHLNSLGEIRKTLEDGIETTLKCRVELSSLKDFVSQMFLIACFISPRRAER